MTSQPNEAVSGTVLRDILAGCEGVTPGPWKTWAVEFVYSSGPDGANICAASEPRATKEIGYTKPALGSEESATNALHIARLDPQTIASIVSELIARREADVWQPIETAPKDGTWIMCLVPGRVPTISKWREADGKARFSDEPEDHVTEEQWLEYWHNTDYRPTLWRPLPTLSTNEPKP